jgi:hypothetical protein
MTDGRIESSLDLLIQMVRDMSTKVDGVCDKQTTAEVEMEKLRGEINSLRDDLGDLQSDFDLLKRWFLGVAGAISVGILGFLWALLTHMLKVTP